MNPPLEVDWQKEYGELADYELDDNGIPMYVRKIDPVEAQQARRHTPIPRDDFDLFDDGARLDTPENHRAKAIDKMTKDNDLAEATAVRARNWAKSVGYPPQYIDKISEAVEALGEAADLINTIENRQGRT